jgi:hypothetical protein
MQQQHAATDDCRIMHDYAHECVCHSVSTEEQHDALQLQLLLLAAIDMPAIQRTAALRPCHGLLNTAAVAQAAGLQPG